MQSLEYYRISPATGCLLSHPVSTFSAPHNLPTFLIKTTPPETLMPFYELLKNCEEIIQNGGFREAVEKVRFKVAYVAFLDDHLSTAILPLSKYNHVLIFWQLPDIDTTQLKTHEEKRLAHKVLAFLGSRYCWQDGFKSPVAVGSSNFHFFYSNYCTIYSISCLLLHVDFTGCYC